MKKSTPSPKPKTAADYAKIFNDIGRLLGHSDLRIIEDDIMLLRESIVVRVDLKKLGSMSFSLNRREFDRTINKMLKLVVKTKVTMVPQTPRTQPPQRHSGRGLA